MDIWLLVTQIWVSMLLCTQNLILLEMWCMAWWDNINSFYQHLMVYNGKSFLKEIWKILMCFRSHCVSLFGSFQKVTERSRMVVTIQHHIIWNTFNRQSAKIILDNIQCTSNFNMNMFSKSDAAIQTFLCLAKSDSLVFHLYILFGFMIGNVCTF